jgi:hypothetical protein
VVILKLDHDRLPGQGFGQCFETPSPAGTTAPAPTRRGVHCEALCAKWVGKRLSCNSKLLDRVENRDRYLHIQGFVPIDVEIKFDAAQHRFLGHEGQYERSTRRQLGERSVTGRVIRRSLHRRPPMRSPRPTRPPCDSASNADFSAAFTAAGCHARLCRDTAPNRERSRNTRRNRSPAGAA